MKAQVRANRNLTEVRKAHDQQAINRRITVNKGRGTHQIVYTLT